MMDKLEVLFKEKVVWPSKILSSVFVAVLKEKKNSLLSSQW